MQTNQCRVLPLLSGPHTQIEAMVFCLSHHRTRCLAVRGLLSCWDCSNIANPKQLTVSSLAFPTETSVRKKKKNFHLKHFPRPCFLLPKDTQESSPCVPVWRGVCLLSSRPVRMVNFVPEPLLLWPHLNDQLIKEYRASPLSEHFTDFTLSLRLTLRPKTYSYHSIAIASSILYLNSLLYFCLQTVVPLPGTQPLTSVSLEKLFIFLDSVHLLSLWRFHSIYHLHPSTCL